MIESPTQAVRDFAEETYRKTPGIGLAKVSCSSKALVPNGDLNLVIVDASEADLGGGLFDAGGIREGDTLLFLGSSAHSSYLPGQGSTPESNDFLTKGHFIDKLAA